MLNQMKEYTRIKNKKFYSEELYPKFKKHIECNIYRNNFGITGHLLKNKLRIPSIIVF
jgi:hypothetical protein